MRIGLKKRIGILLCAGMAFSQVTWPEGVSVADSVGSFAAAEEIQAIDTTVYTDDATGYTYTVYEETVSTSDGSDSGADNPVTVQKAEITGYIGTDWNLVIPSTVDKEGTKIPVGSIGASAFAENDNVTGVTISEGVEKIKYKAFYGCTNVTSVYIPSTIRGWGDEYGHIGSGTTLMNNNAFEDCTKLTDLQFAEGIDYVGKFAFKGCTALESLTVPAPVIIQEGAFSYCTALKDLNLEEGVKRIDGRAFEGCTALTEVTIPPVSWGAELKINNSSYTNRAFLNCTSLSKVTFQDGLKTLGYSNLFEGCTSLKSVTVPDSVEDITYGFYNCDYLEEIILPENLKKIGAHAFEGCKSLKKITIPSTVTEVGEGAFADCTSLKTLIFPPNCTTFTGNVSITGGCTVLDSVYLLCEDLVDCTPQGLCFSLSLEGKVYCLERSSTYEQMYELFAQNNRLSQLSVLTPDMLGVTMEGYQGVYDGKAHPLVTLSGTAEGDVISYCMLKEDGTGGESLEEVPKMAEPGNYTVKVTVNRDGIKYVEMVQTEIQKRTTIIILSDMTVYEEDNWEIIPEMYDGPEDIVYTYYRDEALRKRCTGKPTVAGVYYVKATIEESEHYTAGESNVAKIEILEGSAPVSVTNPPADSGTGPSKNPGTSSGTNTGTQLGTSATNQGTSSSAGNKVKQVTVKKVSLKKVKSKKKKTLLIQWKKVSGVTGYQIQIATNKKITKGKKTYTVKKAKTVKKTIQKLKSKKKYYVRVCAYKKVNGKKYYGKYSSVKSVRIK